MGLGLGEAGRCLQFVCCTEFCLECMLCGMEARRVLRIFLNKGLCETAPRAEE